MAQLQATDLLQLDAEDAALILRLQREDAQAFLAASGGQNLDDGTTDAVLACQLYVQELERSSTLITDRVLTRSIAAGVRTVRAPRDYVQRADCQVVADVNIAPVLREPLRPAAAVTQQGILGVVGEVDEAQLGERAGSDALETFDLEAQLPARSAPKEEANVTDAITQEESAVKLDVKALGSGDESDIQSEKLEREAPDVSGESLEARHQAVEALEAVSSAVAADYGAKDPSYLEEDAFYSAGDSDTPAEDTDFSDSEEGTYPPEDPGLFCVACQNYCFAQVVATLPCNHNYCFVCLQELFTTSFKDSTLCPPRCCRQTIDVTCIEYLLDSDTVNLYNAKKIEHDTVDKTYCSKPACSTFITAGRIMGKLAICGECRSGTCITCKKAAHIGDCSEDDDLQQVLTLASQEHWQQCTRCKRVVELSTGCNHITYVLRPSHILNQAEQS